MRGSEVRPTRWGRGGAAAHLGIIENLDSTLFWNLQDDLKGIHEVVNGKGAPLPRPCRPLPLVCSSTKPEKKTVTTDSP